MQSTLSIRLSKQEKATLEKLALLHGTSVTKFVRSKIFDVENHNANGSNNDNLKYLVPILQSVLATQKLLIETTGSQVSQERHKEILDIAIRAVEKLTS